MEAARDLVGLLVEFSPCMEHGQNDFEGTLVVLLHRVDGDPPAVILDQERPVFIDDDADTVAEPGQRLIDGIIHDFIHKVVEPTGISTPDIHGRAFTYRLEPFRVP